ncbi:single-stranded-DNA-specific exonuclease RecJ [Sphingobacterium hungaricum]|uniref:Single-stranded-DNA-specific exonuclease RecJ n=1 Tax=Sphingobacterium hungaricum TaxID=2082723 RepID=A0A928UV90_9SPHI|nr:single-stranded-DNA-specific exonuclease RecJ [Sphingobacterium hungaricum]MBE8713347.1 single-stranded-DNA-specific exonuclease RecJ [Sphingobacterium hungaricum]
MQKRWVVKPKNDIYKINSLGEELGISATLSNILIHRNIETFDEARQFFRPTLDDLHDPFLMKDMDKAIYRIETAIGNKEKILIYGDYDVDGTTAVATVYSFFRNFHSGMDFYIPDRYEEGYGISKQGIDFAHANGFTLIIALDCGIKEIENIQYAKEKNIDFIIGDHHLPGSSIPDAYAVLDPKRSDCNYPYNELSGCGIGFKLVQAFILKNDLEMTDAYQYLDLVAVSIASDIVPITGENRILAHFGLKKLNSNPNCGLQTLVDLSTNKNSHFGINDILFQIGPRINAAGRIDHAKNSVQLLISKSLQESESIAKKIDQQNSTRKEVDLKITEEALALLDSNSLEQHKKSTVLFKEDWHKGVIGIVASRLTDKYYRPTIILTETNGHIAGSARSVLGYDIYEALTECSDLLDQFGGHKYAAGLTMKRENVELFQLKFEEIVSNSIPPELLQQELLIDQELNLAEIDAKFFRILNQLEPFGPSNEKPLFQAKNLSLYGPARIVGKNHLKLSVVQEGSKRFDCIAFGLADELENLSNHANFEICFSIEENIWKENHNLQLNIKAIRY